jgi:hypothetical protein
VEQTALDGHPWEHVLHHAGELPLAVHDDEPGADLGQQLAQHRPVLVEDAPSRRASTRTRLCSRRRATRPMARRSSTPFRFEPARSPVPSSSTMGNVDDLGPESLGGQGHDVPTDGAGRQPGPGQLAQQRGCFGVGHLGGEAGRQFAEPVGAALIGPQTKETGHGCEAATAAAASRLGDPHGDLAAGRLDRACSLPIAPSGEALPAGASWARPRRLRLLLASSWPARWPTTTSNSVSVMASTAWPTS